jgi:hypothetical protein
VSDDLAELAADAYMYGFPLIFDLQMAGGQAGPGDDQASSGHQPGADILDGTYEIPPIAKAAS